jgi:hypothetical protein
MWYNDNALNYFQSSSGIFCFPARTFSVTVRIPTKEIKLKGFTCLRAHRKAEGGSRVNRFDHLPLGDDEIGRRDSDDVNFYPEPDSEMG